MKTSYNFLIISLFALLIGLSGCSKEDEVVLEPADQVAGIYNGLTYSEAVDGVSQTYDLTSTALKDNVTITLTLTKVTSSVVTVGISIAQRDSNGVMQTTTDSLENVDLVQLSTGDFELRIDGQRLGQVGNGSLSLEQTFPDTDSQGKAIEVNVKITAKKSANWMNIYENQVGHNTKEEVGGGKLVLCHTWFIFKYLH